SSSATPTAEASSPEPEPTIALSGWFISARSLRTPMKRLRRSSPSSRGPRSSPTSKSWMDVSGCVRRARSISAEDLSEHEQKLVWATQGVPQPELFETKVGGTAWKSKPSWYIVGKKDRTVHPDLERAMAKRMGATTYELDSSHVPMLSQPERVIDVIRTAAKAFQGATAVAQSRSGILQRGQQCQ